MASAPPRKYKPGDVLLRGPQGEVEGKMSDKATDDEAAARKKKQQETIDALKRSKGGPTEQAVVKEGTEMNLDRGGSGSNPMGQYGRRTLTGFDTTNQADALRQPITDNESPAATPPSPEPSTKPPVETAKSHKRVQDMTDAEFEAGVKDGSVEMGAASLYNERQRRKNAKK